MAYALCQYNPRMIITVCELPSVVNYAHHFKPSIEACPNQGNVSFAACDFIKSDLPKADLYVLCRTLHNWSDEKVDFILSKVFESLLSGMYFFKSLTETTCIIPNHRGSFTGGRTFRKAPYFVPSKPQTAFVFF